MEKWRECSNERARDNQRTRLKKGEQIEKHNEGRTENTKNAISERTEDQSLSEMDGDAEKSGGE